MSTLIESLLHQNEGTALDFKKEQYPFQRATDEQKSELLKDICIFFGAVIFLVLGFLVLTYFLPKLENRFFSALTFLAYLFFMAKLFNAGIKKLKQEK